VIDGRLEEAVVEVALVGSDPRDRARQQVRLKSALPAGIDLSHAALIHVTAVAQARKDAQASVGERVAAGFGRTAAGVGIIIALAAITRPEPDAERRRRPRRARHAPLARR